jgi:hypothetical protein
MVVKNLLDSPVKAEIIQRINALTPQSQPLWGKMNVAQMLAHLQVPIKVALGTATVTGNFWMRMLFPLFKKILYNETVWKKGMPTDKSYVMTGTQKDFEKEKTALLELLQLFTEERLTSEKHPVFGTLTREQWAKATWKHLDHHLRQFGV